MFGNMSPVFPFDTTPGSTDNDPFGLNSITNNQNNPQNGNTLTNQNENFDLNWLNDVNANQANVAQNTPFPNVNNGNNNNTFDLNSAWTSWTNNGGLNPSNGNNNSGQNITNPMSTASSGMSTSFSPLNNLSMSNNPPSRSNSAPAGQAGSTASNTPLNQPLNLGIPAPDRSSSISLNLQTQPQPLQTQPGQVTNGQNLVRTLSGSMETEIQPIGAGPFAMTHPGAGGNGVGFRGSRATPSEVYRTVVKPL